jgi:hypothetical protein
MAQLSIHIDDHSSSFGFGMERGTVTTCTVEIVGMDHGSFLHEIERKFAGELDETIVASFGDNEHSLDLGSDTRAA